MEAGVGRKSQELGKKRCLKMETILEKEDRPPQDQARLSVIQPKILISLSSITFPFTIPCSQFSTLPTWG
jgi:hypothetical protein